MGASPQHQTVRGFNSGKGRARGAWADKPWRDAIAIAVNERTKDGGKKLRRLADALVEQALAGDVAALKEIGDRLDGKPAQAITGHDGGAIYHAITWQPPA